MCGDWRQIQRQKPTSKWRYAKYLAYTLSIPVAAGAALIIAPISYGGRKFKDARIEKKKHKLFHIPPEPEERQDLAYRFSTSAMKHQQQSPLYKLPVELRHIIFNYILGERPDFHIKHCRGKLTSYGCVEANERSVPSPHDACQIELEQVPWTRAKSPSGEKYERLGALGYLQTCRAVYVEHISLLYSQINFMLSDYESFLAFTSSLSPQHFCSIRRITLSSIGRLDIRSLHDLDDNDVTPRLYTLNMFAFPSDYTSLNIGGFKPNLPILKPLPQNWKWRHLSQLDGDKLDQIRGILRSMTALREIRLESCLRVPDADQGWLHGKRFVDAGMRDMKKELGIIWPGGKEEEWSDFEKTTAVRVVHDMWMGIITLNRNR